MNFSAWVLTIVGVVFLTLIVDIILPDGETNKYIKGIFAIVTVLVIAAPIPMLVKADFDFSSLFGESSILQIDEDYLSYLFEQRSAVYESTLQQQLAEEGISGAEFTFLPDTQDYVYSVGSVLVDMKNIVISEQTPNINASEKIAELLFSVVGVNSSKVVFYA